MKRLANSRKDTWRYHFTRHASVGSIPVLLAVFVACWPARAENEPGLTAVKLSQFGVNENDREASVPTQKQADSDPLNFGYFLLDLTGKAEDALRQKNLERAGWYYRAIAKATPDASIPFSKLCEIYSSQGEYEKAVTACRDALARNGVRVGDYQRFVDLVLSKTGELADSERQAVQEAIAHLKKDMKAQIVAAQLQCRYGIHVESQRELEACTTTLGAMAPRDPQTISYDWALATLRKDDEAARRTIAKARSLGLHLEGVELMESISERTHARKPTALIVVGGFALLFGALGLLLAWRRGRLPAAARSRASLGF